MKDTTTQRPGNKEFMDHYTRNNYILVTKYSRIFIIEVYSKNNLID